MCPIIETEQQLELYCPRCQYCQVCVTELPLSDFPVAGWPDSPASFNFYKLEEKPKHRDSPFLLETDLSQGLTQCPECQFYFRLQDGRVEAPGPSPFSLTEALNWEDIFHALERQRFSKGEEFQIRMMLWQRANDERRIHKSFGGDLRETGGHVLALIRCFFSKWHLMAILVFALGGFFLGALTGDDWQDAGRITLVFASFPATFLAVVTTVIAPVLFSETISRHLRARQGRKNWSKAKSLYRKNLEIVLPFLNESDPIERLVKVEGHRELGQFDAARALLKDADPNFVPELYSFLDRALAQSSSQFQFEPSLFEALNTHEEDDLYQGYDFSD